MTDFTYGIVTRPQVEAWLLEAWREGIPPEMQGIVLTEHTDNFKGLDWSGAHLEGSVLSQVDLSESRFIGSHLIETDFTWSLLDDCNLEGAILADTTLNMSWCRRARFVRARFFKVRANSATFTDTNFIGHRIAGTSYCN